MSYTQENLKTFQKNELKSRNDTFRFNCKMCGKCCRNRRDPIPINGADAFRMARALGVSIEKAIMDNTTCYLGEHSHAPVIVLKERLDGSCRMLRKGRCMIQQDKPAVCALYPLGRYQDLRDGSMHYFMNPNACIGCATDNVWTLQDWLDTFKLEETERMSAAWNELFGGITAVTSRMAEKNISEEMREEMVFVLYFHYDLDRPFIEQVEENKTMIRTVFHDRFQKNIHFN